MKMVLCNVCAVCVCVFVYTHTHISPPPPSIHTSYDDDDIKNVRPSIHTHSSTYCTFHSPPRAGERVTNAWSLRWRGADSESLHGVHVVPSGKTLSCLLRPSASEKGSNGKFITLKRRKWRPVGRLRCLYLTAILLFLLRLTFRWPCAEAAGRAGVVYRIESSKCGFLPFPLSPFARSLTHTQREELDISGPWMENPFSSLPSQNFHPAYLKLLPPRFNFNFPLLLPFGGGKREGKEGTKN